MTGASRLAAALGLLAAVAAGCDCLRNTAEQEHANRRWRECTRERHDVTLDRVDTPVSRLAPIRAYRALDIVSPAA